MDHRDSAEKLAMQLASMQLNSNIFNNISQELERDGSCLAEHFSIGNGQTLQQITDAELKAKRSQNMTECVPVPSSEHVAEIVGRQGCKIKALRAKTNTYIKTPVRGEEPVFVVTGRKEDVGCAKREILSAADHFSQIRATRKNNINSTLALGQMMANTPGQTTIQVRVPYRVVGLVVGPKGATIKRIQQQTHTYIVTPSRDKEPVFEVTGLPENVDMAKKDIEAHIEQRTGGPMDGDNLPSDFNSAFSNGSPVLGAPFSEGTGGKSMLSEYSSAAPSLLSRLNSGGSSGSNQSNGLSGLGSNNFLSNNLNEMTLNSLLDSNNFDNKFDNKFDDKFDSNFDLLSLSRGGGGGAGREEAGRSIGRSLWGCGDSHDSGIGHSPPYDSADWGGPPSSGAIWNELGAALGSMGAGGGDTPGSRHSPACPVIAKPNPRSASIDLGISLAGGAGPQQQQQEVAEVPISLPFTLESLSASLSTLSQESAHARQESSLLAGLVTRASPDTEHGDSGAFPSVGGECKGPGINKDFLSFSN